MKKLCGYIGAVTAVVIGIMVCYYDHTFTELPYDTPDMKRLREIAEPYIGSIGVMFATISQR